MKTFITTAALVAALTLPAFAEGSEETRGEALGNLKVSTISPSQDPMDRNEIGISAMAQGSLARIVRRSETSGSGSASSASADVGGGGLFLFSPGSSGADGGSRK
ncbi:MAG: hypothetical protein QOD94_2865 [Alphaproteobacteria bacterium]|nr:hypothetical protein [Alphaproteobacteria bacterium]